MDNEKTNQPSTFDPELAARLLAALHAQWREAVGQSPGIQAKRFQSPLIAKLMGKPGMGRYLLIEFIYEFVRLRSRFTLTTIAPIVDRRGYELQAAIARNLIQALEPMKSTDAHLVNAAVRSDLYYALVECGGPKSTFYSPGLAKALLRVLAFVGDKQAMDYINYIAEMGIVDTFHESVCTAAVHSRDAIRERLERERQGEKLLRPAQKSLEDTLLHPVNGGNGMASQDLLRPAQQPSSNYEKNRTQ
jgi:hypothetical protein